MGTPTEHGQFAKDRAAWRERNERQLASITPLVDSGGVEHELLYGPGGSGDAAAYADQVGFPGEFPFTRGVYSGMYRKAPWRINQYSGFGSAEDTNARWKFLFERGQMVFNLALDLPTQMGYDSDDSRIQSEVGRTGVAIDTVEDLERMLDGLPMVPMYFNIAGAAPIMLAMQVAVAERKGVGPEGIMGAYTNDILTTFICRGSWIYPPEIHMKLITDMIEYAVENMSPNFYPLNVQSVYFRSLGCSLGQELAFTFADAMTYVDWALERGMNIDTFARRLSFFFGCGAQMFSEAAKFRAGRRLWAHLMRDRYGAKEKESMRMKCTAAAGGRYFQAVEPMNNLMRGAYGILGAVLGGAQATFLAGYDEAYALPNEESAMFGLRTIQILQEETDVARTIDPLGGSYYVEALTDEIEADAKKWIDIIDERGGVIKGIRDGWIRSEMDGRFYEMYQREKSGATPIVGVNSHRQENVQAEALQLHEHDPAVQQRQAARLADVRKRRDQDAVDRALDAVRAAADAPANIMPLLIDAARALATVGEISGIFEDVHGRFGDPNVKVG